MTRGALKMDTPWGRRPAASRAGSRQVRWRRRCRHEGRPRENQTQPRRPPGRCRPCPATGAAFQSGCFDERSARIGGPRDIATLMPHVNFSVTMAVTAVMSLLSLSKDSASSSPEPCSAREGTCNAVAGQRVVSVGPRMYHTRVTANR